MCKYLNYVEHLLFLASAVNEYLSISAFDSLVCFHVGITSSAVRLEMCAISAGIKKYKSIIKKKKKKKYDKIVLLGKTKLDNIEVLIFKALIDSYISHDEFESGYNVLREYNELKEQIRKS